MEIHPRKGVSKKREVSKHQETLSLVGLWRGLEPQRAIIKTHKLMPNGNSQWHSSPDARICHYQAGAGQGSMGCIA